MTAVGHLQRQYGASGTKCKLLVEPGSRHDTVRHLCHWAFQIFPKAQVQHVSLAGITIEQIFPQIYAVCGGFTLRFLLFFILLCLFQARLSHIAFCLSHPSTRIIGTHPTPMVWGWLLKINAEIADSWGSDTEIITRRQS